MRPMRRWFALLVFAAFAWAAPAWSAPPFGLGGGITESRFHGGYGDAFADRYRAGSAVGAHTRIELSNAISLQPELWWVMKGADHRGRIELIVTNPGPEPGVSVESVTYRIQHAIPYVEIPMLLRARARFGRAWEPFVMAGPTMAVKVGGRAKLDADAQNALRSSRRIQLADIFEDVGTFDSIRPRYRLWDWGITGGAGVAFGSATRYVAQVRYAHGFVNVMPSAALGSSHNGAFAFLLGIEWR